MKRWGLACLMLVGFAGEAKVEVDWRQESGGAVLAFTIRSANFVDAPRDWETDCGGLLSWIRFIPSTCRKRTGRRPARWCSTGAVRCR
ncbi:Uncharacterised protein [Acinetobacter baumannii]|nr:Uncharacterised protein [Acinetobacter baumannii]